jgi:hypothetical protein
MFLEKVADLLSDSMDSNSLIAVHLDRTNAESFRVGYVRHIDKGSVVLSSVDSDGQSEGDLSFNLRDVVRVHYDSPYLDGIRILVNNSHRVGAMVEAALSIRDDVDSMLAILRHALYGGYLVAVTDHNRIAFSGFVTEVSESYLTLHTIDDSGASAGTFVWQTEDIWLVERGNRTLLNLEFLSKCRLGIIVPE